MVSPELAELAELAEFAGIRRPEFPMKEFFQVGLSRHMPVPPEGQYSINKEDSHEHRTTRRTTRIRHFYLWLS